MFGIRKKQKNSEIIKELAGENGLQITPYSPKNDFCLTQYKRLNALDMCAILPAMQPLFKSLSLGSATAGAAPAATSGELYRVILPKGAHLAKFHNENAYIGSAVKDGKGVVGQARFIPAKANAASATKAACSLKENASALVNPSNLIIAVALLSLDKKLSDVRETGERVLAFLQTKELTQIEGNVEILNDIFENYKYNLNNSLYKTNKHAQAQTIKSEAEKSIKLYRAQIDDELKKHTFLHRNKHVDEKLTHIERLNDCYKFALYCYSFAYFIEIMLFENLEPDYLNSVLTTLERHKAQYLELKNKALLQLEQYADTSVQAYAVKAFEKISEGASKLAAKIPAGKPQKTELLSAETSEETCAPTSEKISAETSEKSGAPASEKISAETSEKSGEPTSETHALAANSLAKADDFITPFIENIKFIKSVQGGAEILIATDAVYVKG